MITLFSQEEVMEAYKAECRREGRREGIKEGRREGRREGIKEGRKEGKIDLIKSLLSLGTVPIEEIQKATGWTREQIEAVRA